MYTSRICIYIFTHIVAKKLFEGKGVTKKLPTLACCFSFLNLYLYILIYIYTHIYIFTYIYIYIVQGRTAQGGALRVQRGGAQAVLPAS